MKHCLLCFAVLATGIFMPKMYAQTENDSIAKDTVGVLPSYKNDDEEYYAKRKKEWLEAFEEEKRNIVETEKYDLKKLIDKIDTRLEKKEITPEKAQALKEEAAKKAAQNIDNKTAIIDNQIALVERDVVYSYKVPSPGHFVVGLGNSLNDSGSLLLGFEYKAPDKKPKYDKRTYTDMVFAFGFGGTAGGGIGLGDQYKVWESGYSEIGFTFRTRMLKENNFIRLVYGISFSQNQLTPMDNKYFVNNNEHTELQVYPNRIKRNTFRIENFTLPFFFEFGPSEKKEYKDYFRYSTANDYKIGIGGFAGVNVGAVQWMKYEQDGKDHTVKTRQDYNVSRFVYGLKGYVGIGSMSIFAHYELNTVFSSSEYKDHALYFGLRTDL